MNGEGTDRERPGFGWPSPHSDLLAVCRHRTDGEILDCTTRFAVMLKADSARDLIGDNLFSYYVNASDPAHLLSLLEADSLSEPVDICLERTDGRLIWTLQVSVFEQNMGRPAVLSSFTDITERKLAELLYIERAEAEAIMARAITAEMTSDGVGSVLQRFRAGTPRRPETTPAELADGHTTLSPREMRVMVLTGHGSSLKEIASELGVSLKSVSTYRTRVMAKLGLKSTAEIMAYVIRHRLK